MSSEKNNNNKLWKIGVGKMHGSIEARRTTKKTMDGKQFSSWNVRNLSDIDFRFYQDLNFVYL